jgi:hypothetical protein
MSDKLKVSLNQEEYDSLLALVKTVKAAWPSCGDQDKPVAKVKLNKVEHLSGILFELERAERVAQKELSEKEALDLLMREPEITKREALEKTGTYWTGQSEKVCKLLYKAIREAAEAGRFRVSLGEVLSEVSEGCSFFSSVLEKWLKGLEFTGVIAKIKELGFTYVERSEERYPSVSWDADAINSLEALKGGS